MGELTVAELLDRDAWAGNPNGFKLGSKFTDESCIRTLTNCIAYDHGKKGFDKNNSSCNISLKNCISFDNDINYQLITMNITNYENIYGWDGKSDDEMADGYVITVPDGCQNTENKIRSAGRAMSKFAAQNKIGKTDVFELFGS